MKNIVIQNDANQFLTSSNTWSDEYPEAKIFSSFNQAKNAMRKNDETGVIKFIENYGFEDQKVIDTWKISGVR